MNIWEWEQRVKIFVLYVKAHERASERASTMEEGLNSWIDKIIPPGLLSATSVLAQRIHEYRGHDKERGTLCMGPTAWAPT